MGDVINISDYRVVPIPHELYRGICLTCHTAGIYVAFATDESHYAPCQLCLSKAVVPTGEDIYE